MSNMKYLLLTICTLLMVTSWGQLTIAIGTVSDIKSGSSIPFAKVQYTSSKEAVLSDTLGRYRLISASKEDSIVCSFTGYEPRTFALSDFQSGSSIDGKVYTIDFTLKSLFMDFDEVTIKAPSELPSTVLIRKVIANKANNNKDGLEAYEYDLYNKIQFDLNNLERDFDSSKAVKKLPLIYNYLDSTSDGKRYLPLILSETISRFFFKNKPKTKREIIEASQTTGVDNIQLNQFLGDMYLELNVYDNIYTIFGKSFISPLSNNCQNHYKYYLDDSSFIDDRWCYRLSFFPKKERNLTFTGTMWISDSSYAVKHIDASISAKANLNFIKDFYFSHHFIYVQDEFWMLEKEKIIADIQLTNKSKVFGFFARKSSQRRNFVINNKRDAEFYRTDNTVEVKYDADQKTKEEWDSIRPFALSEQELGIGNMIDSLNQTPYFKALKNLTYMGATGYYPLGKIELGDVYSLFSMNPVEKYRTALSIRTSNEFSRRIEFGINGAYGFGDKTFKYGASIRCNISPRKRGILTLFYDDDIEQIGLSPYAVSMGNTFATVLNTAPFDKLTFVKKAGLNLEKDLNKDLIVFLGADWREYNPLGLANYLRINPENGQLDTIGLIRTSEITTRVRWAKNEEFISGSFDRTSLRSKYPILSIQGVFGIKGVLGSEYNYQKLEFQLEHKVQLGILGRFYYGGRAGYIFGNAAYPLLNVHAGNQSLWLMTSAFNKLNFLEFISDQYVEAYIENHWDGFFFNRTPLLKKLKIRLVSSGRIAYGNLSSRHESSMLYPSFVRFFDKVPYAEGTIGIENIFKFFRVDLVWRMTHNDPGSNPLGIRGRLTLNF